MLIISLTHDVVNKTSVLIFVNNKLYTMSATTGKKKGGGFLSRQAKSKDKGHQLECISEDELLKKDIVSPDDVLRLNRITESE